MNKEYVRESATLSQAISRILVNSTPKYPDRAGLIGKTVRNKESGDEGTVMFSSFGISIGGTNEDGAHWQTLGDDPKVVMESWEVVDND